MFRLFVCYKLVFRQSNSVPICGCEKSYKFNIQHPINMKNKTVPNSLPIPNPHSAINTSTNSNSGIIFAQDEHEEKNLISPDLDDSNFTVTTTPSSITECSRAMVPNNDPDKSNISQNKRKQRIPKTKWYQDLKVPYVMIAMSSLQLCLYFSISNKKTIQLLLFDPDRQDELWRFISYMLLHKDYVHLLQNILLQCLFAVYLESFESNWKILFVYVGGGIGGALGAASVRSDLLVGASAGVYALLLSCVSYIILNFQNIKYKFGLITAVATIILCDIVYCIFHYFFNVSPTISGGAHMFGAVTGLLIGLTLFGNKWHCNDKQQFSKIIFIVSTVLLILVFFSLIIADVKNTQINQRSNLTVRQRDYLAE